MSDTAEERSWSETVKLVGIGVSLFLAGMSVGSFFTTAAAFNSHVEASERTYVRKDGKELEEIRGALLVLSGKLDLLLEDRRSR